MDQGHGYRESEKSVQFWSSVNGGSEIFITPGMFAQAAKSLSG